ncbi:MAG: hypothetical protein L0Y56_06655 [Nitrospira sp.]|nr:hypothetical protein [Nitrospira sp.]
MSGKRIGPGQRLGGRGKGTPNKKSARAAEILESMGFDALAEMVKMCEEPGVSEPVRCRLLCEIAQYQHPKRKAIEMSGEVGTTVRLVITGA